MMKSKKKDRKFNLKNTKNADKSISSQFYQYLKQVGADLDFWNMNSSDLDAHLSKY